jgi:hypothetical protein
MQCCSGAIVCILVVHGRNDRLGNAVFVPRKLHAREGFEVVEPDGLRIVLGKEWTSDPVLVTALEEAQDKGLVSEDFFDAGDLDLACGAEIRND